MKKNCRYTIILLLTACIFLFSCSKENNSDSRLLYGKWKTSYGDTITFAEINNKNMVSYDATLNPAMPMTTTQEYRYQDKKLGIKNGWPASGDFNFFKSFRWVQEEVIFEIQGIEWFMFMSSTQTYFTFTKIP